MGDVAESFILETAIYLMYAWGIMWINAQDFNPPHEGHYWKRLTAASLSAIIADESRQYVGKPYIVSLVYNFNGQLRENLHISKRLWDFHKDTQDEFWSEPIICPT